MQSFADGDVGFRVVDKADRLPLRLLCQRNRAAVGLDDLRDRNSWIPVPDISGKVRANDDPAPIRAYIAPGRPSEREIPDVFERNRSIRIV